MVQPRVCAGHVCDDVARTQGTNRPAHYHVLVDEIGFGPDGMQMLTYWLCYLYARCTR